VPENGRPATGPFPVLLSMTPQGKKAPPPAAQIGGGATYDFSHLVPTKPARRALIGGSYQLHQGGPTPSQLLIPVADPNSFS
jgi:hypothetical protein